jgi:hypothetical protein
MVHIPGEQVIYNVTVKVDGSIAGPWLEWLQREHIPRVMSTACFFTNQVVRLLDTDDSEGPTFAIQYYAYTKADYLRYVSLYAKGLARETQERWGDRVIAFRSVMEIVQ